MTADASNHRLAASLAYAAKTAPAIAAKATRSRFTSATARAANAAKYADHQPKPPTATVRVEADVAEAVKAWPTAERVRLISEAIRAALRADEILTNMESTATAK